MYSRTIASATDTELISIVLWLIVVVVCHVFNVILPSEI